MLHKVELLSYLQNNILKLLQILKGFESFFFGNLITRFILTSLPRYGLRLLLFLGDLLLRLAGEVSLLPGERSLDLAGDLYKEQRKLLLKKKGHLPPFFLFKDKNKMQ